METSRVLSLQRCWLCPQGVVQAHPARAFQPMQVWCELPATSHALPTCSKLSHKHGNIPVAHCMLHLLGAATMLQRLLKRLTMLQAC